jgi:hypothetical protein
MAYHVSQFMTQAQISGLNRALQGFLTICAFLLLTMIALGAFQ